MDTTMDLINLDPQTIRRKLLHFPKHSLPEKLTSTLCRIAGTHPENNPWLMPLTAVLNPTEANVHHARQAVTTYLNTAAERGHRSYLFNIWCFAFPHARWAIWFKLMVKAGFYSREEAEEQAAQFLLIHFRDHLPGLLNKPFPECVDNQAAALAISTWILGSLFADTPSPL
ncbi:hypothetical protein D6833_01165, partial [Candidatus Parcubacteria bacterium]